MFKKITKGLAAYKLWGKAYDLVTKWGSNVGEATVNGVPVKSPLFSKINAGGAVMVISGLFDILGKSISAADQQSILESIKTAGTWQDWVLVGGGVLIMIFRTWFNNTVTPSAASGIADPGGNQK